MKQKFNPTPEAIQELTEGAMKVRNAMVEAAAEAGCLIEFTATLQQNPEALSLINEICLCKAAMESERLKEEMFQHTYNAG